MKVCFAPAFGGDGDRAICLIRSGKRVFATVFFPAEHDPIHATMTIRGIRKETISLLLQMGRDAHPNEFIAVLTERDGVIDEVNLLPGTVSNEDSAHIFYDMMPLSTHVAGSCHSHPNGVLRPSNTDIQFFPRTGRFHFIIGYPYHKNDWRCFKSDGEQCHMEVVE